MTLWKFRVGVLVHSTYVPRTSTVGYLSWFESQTSIYASTLCRQYPMGLLTEEPVTCMTCLANSL